MFRISLRYFGLWPFRILAIPVYRRSGLWPLWIVAVSVYCRHGLWPFRFVAFGLWPFRLVPVSVDGRFGLWPFRFMAVPVCGRYGLWRFRSIAVSVCGRSGLWPLVCGHSGLWPFQFVAVSVVAVSVCGSYGLLPTQWCAQYPRIRTIKSYSMRCGVHNRTVRIEKMPLQIWKRKSKNIWRAIAQTNGCSFQNGEDKFNGIRTSRLLTLNSLMKSYVIAIFKVFSPQLYKK